VPQPSALCLLVLHGVRLKGFAEPVAVADLWALDEDEVASELKSLAADGLVQRRDGRVSGWSHTTEGRAEHARLIAEELADHGAGPAVEDAYRRFLEINPELLATCTAWQLRVTDAGQSMNDHTDAAYDAEVVSRLSAVDERVRPVLADLGSALARFSRYPERLGHALRRVQLGEPEWFTKPLVDSYHTVWFELHEDLLATLGLQRGAEGRT
jgi:DNA-binding MarR family transcriptional regulator